MPLDYLLDWFGELKHLSLNRSGQQLAALSADGGVYGKSIRDKG